MKEGERTVRFSSLFFLLIMALAALLVSMGVDEVAAETRQKARKVCGVDCHQDTKADFLSKRTVHAPVKKDQCDKCHDTHGLIPGKLLKKGGTALCYICHKKRDIEKGESVHSAIQGKKGCSSCHDPHSSDLPGLLKVRGNDLCFSCHSEEPYTKANVHKPLVRGCLTCHNPHSSDNPFQLTASSNEICLKCHNIKKKAIMSAHQSIPLERDGNCNGCHTPHSSERKAFIKTEMHPSLAECNVCHNRDGTLTNRPVSKLCFSCHEGVEDELDGKVVHQKVKEGDCLSCHTPHASNEIGLLKADMKVLCSGCHAQIISGQGFVSHTPAKKGECQECHSPHSSDHDGLLKTDLKELCYGCHDKNKITTGFLHKPVEEGDCLSCHNPHGSENKLGLQRQEKNLCDPCHSSTMKLFSLPNAHRPVQERQCGSCHTPHASVVSRSLLREKEGTICLACHPESDAGTQNLKNIHPPFGTGDCSTCHDPHVGETSKHLVKTIPQLCDSCHDAAVEGENIHKPFSEGNCTQCHSAHASDIAYLLQRPVDSLCFSCHSEFQKTEEGENKLIHTPFKTGKCLACHRGHSSNKDKLLAREDPEICLKCHMVDDMQSGKTAEEHLNRDVKKLRCLGCHEPHSSTISGLLHEVVHPPFAERECNLCHQ